MRPHLYILLLLFVTSCSPYEPGTTGTDPFTAFPSHGIQLFNEKVTINIDSGFQLATYEMEYEFRCFNKGKQSPMFFYQMDRYLECGNEANNFEAWVDDLPVTPHRLHKESAEENVDFNFTMVNDYYSSLPNKISPITVANAGVNMITTELDTGYHRLKVRYNTLPSIYMHQPINAYAFHYDPSRNRRLGEGFQLEVNVSGRPSDEEFSTNLGVAHHTNDNGHSQWNFDFLQQVQINYSPKMGPIPTFFYAVGPAWFGILLLTILIVIHYRWMIRFRKRNVSKAFSYPLLIGVLMVPALFGFGAYYMFDFVDLFIGEHANGIYHPRSGFVFILTVVSAIYLMTSILLDTFLFRDYGKQVPQTI